MNSILIVAGENSGDKYGAAFIREFKKIRPSFSFFGIGGKAMAAEGVEILSPVDHLAVVGGFEILSQLPRIKKVFDGIRNEIPRRKPAAAVLIDSPDFNLRLAKALKKLAVPVLYYISPTIWAWRSGRLKTIKNSVDRMLLIFPFEEIIYAKARIPAVFVGHPLKEKVKACFGKDEFCKKYGLDPGRKLITLLPGSRKSEVRYHMPVLIQACRKIQGEFSSQYILVQAETLKKDHIQKLIPPDFNDLIVISEDSYEAMASSELVLSACGTANLESALLGTPLIAFYKISPLSYYAGVKLVKIKNYSIVNILSGHRLIPELIERRFTPENILLEARKILESERVREEMKTGFLRIKDILGDRKASENAAQELDRLLSRIQKD